MAKLCLKKQSKRVPAARRYKIIKKVREHNRKIRKEAKKKSIGKKNKIITVPNICPFKSQILEEVAEYKKRKEEERLKQRELWQKEQEAKKAEKQTGMDLETLVSNARTRQILHEKFNDGQEEEEVESRTNKKSDGSVKAYYKEFKKVIEAADVVLEVVDARDPMGTRCKQVEAAVMESPTRKRLIIVVNKADLVPRENLEKWLKVLRGSFPTVPFKASTQIQSQKLAQRKMKRKHRQAGGELKVSACVGAELLLSLLANYCRNNGIKTAIRVGVVGLPNVGKSSVINSLKRSRACNVGATPGVTKTMQEVQLDSKIKLLDSPGVVFATRKCQDEGSYALKNAVRVHNIDPLPAATAILQRSTKEQMMDLYCLPEYNTPEEFFALKAQRQGKFGKGGRVDINGAARGLIEDWNRGKIRYYTEPPEDSACQVSAEVVQQMAKEFDLETYCQMETDMLQELPESFPQCKPMPVASAGPVDAAEVEEMEQDKAPSSDMLADNVVVDEVKEYSKKQKIKVQKANKAAKKQKTEEELIDKQLLLPGNERKAKKFVKLIAKKKRKNASRTEKAMVEMAGNLENFTL
ncbi:guanine nucleotide-binding protein-like 3 homolog [Macrosteles quadrilineatus]|uniref:guanine nucleotide-binding protein-like 3 homolog n=1 Tax=Macrosteles quadrilineatus TaxID=74068 RepID=UPI0023E2B61E|nr:guanine nucleotide-binding protein-like 3 homolog [Macrosteles quadrilineatus]